MYLKIRNSFKRIDEVIFYDRCVVIYLYDNTKIIFSDEEAGDNKILYVGSSYENKLIEIGFKGQIYEPEKYESFKRLVTSMLYV